MGDRPNGTITARRGPRFLRDDWVIVVRTALLATSISLAIWVVAEVSISLHWSQGVTFRGAVSLGSLVFYTLITRLLHTTTDRPEDVPPLARDLTLLTELVEGLAQELTPVAANAIGQSIITPWQVFSRVSEKVDPGTRAVQVEMTVTIRSSVIDANQPIPVVIARTGKESLASEPELSGVTGNHPLAVHQDEAIAMCAAAMRLLVGASGPDALQKYQHDIEEHVICVLAGLVRVDFRGQPVDDLCSEILTLPHVPGLSDEQLSLTRNGLIRATQILKSLTRDYPIIVVLPPSNNTLLARRSYEPQLAIKLKFRSIPEIRSGVAGGWAQLILKFREGCRWLLGIRPASVIHELQAAAMASSYHLEIAGPKGMYLARQRIARKDGSEASLRDARYAMTPRRGQRHAHLYVRGGQTVEELIFEALFFERLPGTIVPALVSSLAATVLIFLTGMSSILSARAGTPTSTLSSILLAFPAISGAWAALQTDRPYGGTLASQVANLVTIFCSVVAAVVSVFMPILAPDHGSLDTVFDSPHWDVTCWMLVEGLSLIASLALTITWLRRVQTHSYFLKRSKIESGSI